MPEDDGRGVRVIVTVGKCMLFGVLDVGVLVVDVALAATVEANPLSASTSLH
jgi:hypothetical protein